jgi:hypothetical protein
MNEAFEIDTLGICWYPWEVARHWSLGVPVLVRRTSREFGWYSYSVCSHWKGGNGIKFGPDARFLMLERHPVQ